MKKTITIFLLIIMFSAAAAAIISAVSYNSEEDKQASGAGSMSPAHGATAQDLPEPAEKPDIDIDGWNLTLVNADKPLPEDYQITTGVTDDGYLFDERAMTALDQMLADGRAEGLKLALNSAYRTYEYQRMLFENKVSRVIAEQGCGRDEAEEIAAREVARPGVSEHNLGLSADIVSENYGTMDEGYADTPEAKWLLKHCAGYGFILRYPKDKQDITNIIYEPWHFRYVGVEAAEYIMENGLCLEEFLELYD